MRKITAAPTVVAQVDSALPGTHTANLTVRRFAPAANTLRDNAAAPRVQIRFTIHGANPYVQDDELHFRGGEEAWGKVLANPTGQDIFLVDPVELSLRTTNIEVEHITITNRSTPDAKLEESLIMIPSDPGEEPITRRLSDINPLDALTVELPAGATPAVVSGAVDAGAGRVRFRENYYIPLQPRVENAIGAFFAAVQPGDYRLHVPGELQTDLVTTVSFDADFVRLRKIKVKALVVTPEASAARPVYETEQVRFQVQGDASAEYRLRYKGAPPAPAGTIDGLRFTVPVLGAPGPATHTLEITSTYGADNPVFRGPGQNGDARLSAEQRTNLCQEIDVHIEALTVPAIGPVQAGHSQQFQMPIAPVSVTVTSVLPAGAALNASVLNGTGRPAQLTFIAPNAVTAATNVTFDMVFGSGAVTKIVTGTVQVTP